MQGSRDGRAVRRLDFTAGRPSLQFDPVPAFSTADSQASANLPQWGSGPLAEIPAPSGGLLGMNSSTLPDELVPSILGPSTPYASVQHGSQPHQQAQPDMLQNQPMQPFSYDSLLQPRGIRPLQPQQGRVSSFPLQHAHEGMSNVGRPTWPSQQQALPLRPHQSWPAAHVPEWQTGARILPEQQPAPGAGSLGQQHHAEELHAQGSAILDSAGPHAHWQTPQETSPFTIAASSPLVPARTEPVTVTAPLSCGVPVSQPPWVTAARPSPFALPGHASIPFGFPTPSNQPGLPEFSGLHHDPDNSLQPVRGFSHPFGSHQPPGPSERQLFGFNRLASRGSGTGAFMP